MTTATAFCSITVDLDNSNPSFEIISEQHLLDVETDGIDVSCSSGHTSSTQPLSDDDDEEYHHTNTISTATNNFLFNTQTSILNITASEDEEEDEDDEPMMEQLLDDTFQSSSPEFAPQDARTSLQQTKQQCSLMDRMGDLMDSFCASPKDTNARLEQDLVQLMSCFPPPDAQEMKLFSNTHRWIHTIFCIKPAHDQDDLLHGPPVKSSVSQRCRKIRRLLQARRLPPAAKLRTVHSYQHSQAPAAKRNSYSSSSIESMVYDSDPEDIIWSEKRRYQAPKRHQLPPPMMSIEQTLNTTWNLLLHDATSLQTVSVWIERGTLIHSHSMIEPRLMWRRSVTEKPHSIYLLHISRIRACDTEDALPILAQAHTSLLLRTHEDTFYFQAPDVMTRDAIVESWKTLIARFAALAVLEDAPTILNEFFVVPTL